MSLVVIGGHSRSVGKTSVVAGLIAALREFDWIALKITQYGHGICSAHGEACDCATGDHSWAISEEHDKSGESDTSRFLVAGAHRAFWVRTEQGRLAEAMPTLRQRIEGARNVIIESNSILELVQPDVFLMLLDFSCEDFKASSLRFMDRADAFLVLDRGINAPLWEDVARGMWDGKPQFLIKPPRYVTAEVAEFVVAGAGSSRK